MSPVRRERRAAGFTLMEVMVAIGLITVGAAGIMAMQQASIRGNREARAILVATSNTSTWADRLQRTSLTWTTQGTNGVVGLPYLAGLATTNTSTGWFAAPMTDAIESGALDWTGQPTTNLVNARFCTMLRLTWLNVGSSARADVVTWWLRDGGGNGAEGFTQCQMNPAQAQAMFGNPASAVRSVGTSVVIRWFSVID